MAPRPRVFLTACGLGLVVAMVLGVSFGSGYFFSDGFAFDTGGTASLDVSSVATVPEPAILSLIGIGSLALLRRRSRKA